MSIYKDLKRAVISGIDVLADKTATQAQKSRLVTVMKNEEKIANQAYVALGKYLYSSMREGMPEDVQQLCKVIDASKERMSRMDICLSVGNVDISTHFWPILFFRIQIY